MPAEIVIRGGTVYDGSGASGFEADVAISDGVIREIGPNLRGERELDASGCAVTPGFIDVHTHYDAQVFWDPALRPSSYQGVTTVVAGNCGFSIAPTRPEDHEVIVKTLENVEDMNAASLVAGVPWGFETHPEYLAAVRRSGSVLNFTAYVGHSAVRIYVMGHAAYERPAKPDEIEQMCTIVREAIEAGAAGFSTSFAYTHLGVDGMPVPSRFAEHDEIDALFMETGRTGKGVVLATPGPQCMYDDMYAWQRRIGRPFLYPLFGANGRHAEQLRLHAEALEQGGSMVYPQVTPRPLTFQFTMENPFQLNVSASFAELLRVGRGVRTAAYRDPAWRKEAAASLERSESIPRWNTCEVSESRRWPELVGRRVDELASERGVHPVDVLCELSVEENLETRFRMYSANDDEDEVAYLLNMDQTILGLSDAGAHVGQLCDAPLYTDLVGNWVRDHKVLSLERAVRKSTGEAADIFGFVRRGYLREGYWADVCVFDPQTLSPGPLRRVRDFPADGERITAEEPTGLQHVLVNGTPIRLDGEQLDLGDRRPGVQPEIV